MRWIDIDKTIAGRSYSIRNKDTKEILGKYKIPLDNALTGEFSQWEFGCEQFVLRIFADDKEYYVGFSGIYTTHLFDTLIEREAYMNGYVLGATDFGNPVIKFTDELGNEL